MRKPPRSAASVRKQRAALAPVWVEADELRAFKAWWDRLADGERTARRAFLHGFQRSDGAWAVVYQRECDELREARESLRVGRRSSPGCAPPMRDFGGSLRGWS